jgi:hypothetical protein
MSVIAGLCAISVKNRSDSTKTRDYPAKQVCQHRTVQSIRKGPSLSLTALKGTDFVHNESS